MTTRLRKEQPDSMQAPAGTVTPGQRSFLVPKAPRPSRTYRWGTLVAVLVLGGLALYFGKQFASEAQVAPLAGIPSAKVEFGSLEKSLRVTGSTVAKNGVVMRAPALRGSRTRGGSRDFQLELTKLADPGTKVKEGDVIAVFDNESMRNRLDDLQAERVNLDGLLKRMKADQLTEDTAHAQAIRVARAQMEMARLDLLTAPVRSAIQAQGFALTLEEATAAAKALVEQTPFLNESHAAQIRSLQLQLDAAALEERRAQANMDRLTVRSPIDGLAVAQEIYRGGDYGQVRNGDQLRSGQPYVRIVDIRNMIVDASVNQVDVDRLRIGDPVHVSLDAYPGLHLPGRVRSIGSIASNDGRRAEYVAEVPVSIEIEHTEPRVIPSLSVGADVVLASAKDTEILPREAVFHDLEAGRDYAYVETHAGWERRPLELALENNVSVAVRSGVREGETVALQQPDNWIDSESRPTTTAAPGAVSATRGG